MIYLTFYSELMDETALLLKDFIFSQFEFVYILWRGSCVHLLLNLYNIYIS